MSLYEEILNGLYIKITKQDIQRLGELEDYLKGYTWASRDRIDSALTRRYLVSSDIYIKIMNPETIASINMTTDCPADWIDLDTLFGEDLKIEENEIERLLKG